MDFGAALEHLKTGKKIGRRSEPWHLELDRDGSMKLVGTYPHPVGYFQYHCLQDDWDFEADGTAITGVR